MAEGDFFHREDIGKLIGAASSVTHLAKQHENATGFKPNRLPSEFVSIRDKPLDPLKDFEEPLQLCHLIGVDETEFNVVFGNLINLALEFEDIRDEFKRLFMLAKLRATPRMQSLRAILAAERRRYDNNLQAAIEGNAKRREEWKRNNDHFLRRSKEQTELMKTRKEKFIRSINKALEKAKVPSNLSESDKRVYAVLERHKWAGYDGSRFCAAEGNIMMATPEETKAIMMEAIGVTKPEPKPQGFSV